MGATERQGQGHALHGGIEWRIKAVYGAQNGAFLCSQDGPGVYYTLAREVPEAPQATPQVTAELPRLLAEGKRLSSNGMIELLEALCAERPRTARELAQLLRRNMKCLRDTYLSLLVRQGRLELTGLPNDPNVAYRAACHPETERGGNRP